jgi:glycosidase
MTVPPWVYDAIIYQIFPDRFANGDSDNDPPNVHPWGAEPTLWHFQGGDLQGVLQHFDYLLDLGVTTLYFNPIFKATANHRYNTYDYMVIDPRLGTLEDFQALLRHAHKHGVRILLDGVFNHCGRGFFAFNDVLENQEHSHYKEWFHIKRFPVRAYGPGKAEDYLAWWDIKSLPKFNTDNPDVRQYLMEVARHWTEQGIDGWRLDVPNEIDDDSFWAEFYEVVKGINPGAYLLGEIWDVDPRWVGAGHFDGLTNYPLRQALRAFLLDQSLSPSAFLAEVERITAAYPWEHTLANVSLLGSHDTRRLWRLCDGHVDRILSLYFLVFTLPGVPHIYYGDEVGLDGGKDPDNRRAFPWDPARWNERVRQGVKDLISLRRRSSALRRGRFKMLAADDALGTLAFLRGSREERVLVALNRSPEGVQWTLTLRGEGLEQAAGLRDLRRGDVLQVREGRVVLDLPPAQGRVLEVVGPV